MQRATYSPVHSDSDSENETNNDATPVRRFRLNTRDGHARPLPSPSHSPSPSSRGQDELDRAMREFYAGGTRQATNDGNSTSNATANGASGNIASPLPQRHGSISSSKHSIDHGAHSRHSSSQHTFVDESTSAAPWANSQPQFPQLTQQQHSGSQSHPIQYPQLAQQQPQHGYTLPPLPPASPLYPQNTFSTVTRPVSAFSTASGPQIVPVHPWADSRSPSALSSSGLSGFGAPNSAYGQPFANAHLALGTNVQPTGQRNSYLSHTHTGSEDGDGTAYSEDEIEDELVGQRSQPYNHHHPNHSQFLGQSNFGQQSGKPFGGWMSWNASKASIGPNAHTPRPLNPDAISPDGDMFATQPDTKHYGPAPAGAQERRRLTKKKIALTEGHLVLDLPVPSK